MRGGGCLSSGPTWRSRGPADTRSSPPPNRCPVTSREPPTTQCPMSRRQGRRHVTDTNLRTTRFDVLRTLASWRTAMVGASCRSRPDVPHRVEACRPCTPPVRLDVRPEPQAAALDGEVPASMPCPVPGLQQHSGDEVSIRAPSASCAWKPATERRPTTGRRRPPAGLTCPGPSGKFLRVAPMPGSRDPAPVWCLILENSTACHLVDDFFASLSVGCPCGCCWWGCSAGGFLCLFAGVCFLFGF
jgi:hypothetical protein